MVIRDMLQSYRLERRLSFVDLSEQCGIDDTTLWRFEQGKPIDESNWMKLLSFFFSSTIVFPKSNEIAPLKKPASR